MLRDIDKKLPFEGYPLYDYAHVLEDQRPSLLEDVEGWMHNMLNA